MNEYMSENIQEEKLVYVTTTTTTTTTNKLTIYE